MIYKTINALVIISIIYILIFKLLPAYNTYLHTKKNINMITAKISNVKIAQVKTLKQKNVRFNTVIGGTAFKFLGFLRTNGIKYTILKNNQAILTTNYRIIKYLPSYVLIQSVSNNNIKLSY
ncbi:MAG: hypothetical protein ACYCSW_04780 [bacterium]|jgi:hypothetical protein